MADDKTQVSAQAQASAKDQAQVVKAVQEGKAVFSPRKVEDFEKTPEWMKKSSEETANKIEGAEKAAEPAPGPVVQLKAEKPSKTAIGEDPSSTIEVLPSLEVVRKVDVEATKKLKEAGYDPATGHKIDEEKTQEEVTVAQDVKDAVKAEKKKSFFDKVKSLFVFKTKKSEGVVGKVDKAATITDENGKQVKISKKEKQKYIEAEKIYQEGITSIKDLIAPSSMDIQFDSIKVDGVYARTFYVFAYPRYLNANWLAPIVNFDVTMDISQFIYPIDSGAIMKTLKKKVAQMQSSIRIQAEKGHVRDPGLETALEDAEVLRTKIQRGQEKFFQFALYFTIYSESEKKLEKVAKQLESLLAGKLIMTKRCQ
ncbi:MAG: hypothetical protein GWP15_02205, partial [Nitrospirae bacterium]|nr:hypothetical protein [Nitrospirota bacterium]